MAEGRDWTRSQFEACPDCGADASAVPDEQLGPEIVREIAAWDQLMAGVNPDAVRLRPDADTWSALEYACHVRDLLPVMERRIRLLQVEDSPSLGWWDHEAAVLDERYNEQAPAAVQEVATANARSLADALDGVADDQWERSAERRPGEEFTIRGMARFVLHEVIHHRDDAERVLRSASLSPEVIVMPDSATPDELIAKLLLDPAVIPDPHPYYRQLRELAPLFQTAKTHTWVVSGFENSRSLLRDPRCGSPENEAAAAPQVAVDGSTRPARDPESQTMLFMNPPDHTRIRGLVSRAFTPRRVEQLRPEVVTMTDGLLDELGGEGDFVDGVGFPLPANVISALVGVPESDRDWLRPLIADLGASIEPTATEEAMNLAATARVQTRKYLTELIAARRADPQDDLLSGLIEASDGGDRLSEIEVMANVLLIYAAGFETTTHLLGNMVRCFVANPDQLQRVRDDRSLIPSAVEEVLRYDPPVQLDGRFVFEDIEINGTIIEKGSTIITLLAGANRDPAVCDDPEKFDVGRSNNQIMSFGSGIHFCLGAALARLEGQVVLERLLDRYETWEITADPVWRPRITIRGVERLDVKFA